MLSLGKASSLGSLRAFKTPVPDRQRNGRRSELACRAEHREGDSAHLGRRSAGLQLGLGGALLQTALAPEADAFPFGLFEKKEEVITRKAPDGYSFLEDEQLAYAFDYPMSTASGTPLNWIQSRKPEKYSSAAPLTANARQRNVTELLEFNGPYAISVSVGPVPGRLLASASSSWEKEQVVEAVLVERSTARTSEGQAITINAYDEIEVQEKDGTYWVYEHISQGGPTSQQLLSKDTYRHAIAATTVRNDYLYTLTLTAPDNKWDDVAPVFSQAANSFSLTTPTKKFIAPDKDPWKFW